MEFKGDFYARKSEARKRIHTWMAAQSYNEKGIDNTPIQYVKYRGLSWKKFLSKLRDEVSPPASAITEKLEEQGLKEEDGELIKIESE